METLKCVMISPSCGDDQVCDTAVPSPGMAVLGTGEEQDGNETRGDHRVQGTYSTLLEDGLDLGIMTSEGMQPLVEGSDPAWSPDGEKIAFVASGEDKIYSMDADGSNLRILTNDPMGDYSPSWSPDGERIAYSSYSDGGNARIRLMNADGSDKTSITSDIHDSGPDFSPDGEKIVFSRELSVSSTGTFGGNYLHIVDVDGSNIRNLGAAGLNPTFSPNGEEIAFEADGSIYIIDIATSNVRRLLPENLNGSQPTWSPSGEQILYASTGLRGESLHVISADGTGDKNVQNPPLNVAQPDWLSEKTR